MEGEGLRLARREYIYGLMRDWEATPDEMLDIVGPMVLGWKAEIDSEPYEREFEEVWAHYPRKIAKTAARKKYIACRRRGVQYVDLMNATLNYAKDCDLARREQKFMLHGATFFGPADRWEDYLDGVEEEAQPKSLAERARAEYDAMHGGMPELASGGPF